MIPPPVLCWKHNPLCSGQDLAGQLQALRLQNRKTQGFKYTKESAKNVKSAIRQFFYFILYFKLSPYPVSVDTLVCYMEFMARSSGFPHLKHLLSSVKFMHEALDQPFPTNSFMLDMTMQGLKRRLARVPFQVLPLTPGILKRMYPHLNMSLPQDQALWCSYLLSFYGLLRKSNAVPKSTLLDPGKVLTRQNISVDLVNNMVYLYLGYGKTNNFCTRDVIIPIPGNNDPVLDPVRHVCSLFTKVQVDPSAPAFTYRAGSCITYTTFTSRLKSLLKKAGLDPDLYSGHSFRRGGATFLHSCGGTALMIQASGDWSSQCFTRYIYLSEGERLHSQHLMARRINDLV